ncbi:MAG TPA: tRNA glutamyl-Q(34) synthetase GluQRS [Gammaproteobacteria bacterium]|nr:tRNA glutamyl-Q(34) synthetase GluQRS [Gammaproteobacteria bacterium]
MSTYRGRFAPSPTGELHFGSLVAAVGSYLQARARQGIWLVRMEDIDPPREQTGAADSILRTLECYGFEWDQSVLYQSTRSQAYQAALEQLRFQKQVYPCACSRSEIQAVRDKLAGFTDALDIYPGTCRKGLPDGRPARSWRVRAHDRHIDFIDRVQGNIIADRQQPGDDFVVYRADGYYAYQLAVTVDDAWQDITEIVRGADLLATTPRQILLQQYLQLAQPGYAHLPVAINPQGQKLSKQTGATPVSCQQVSETLYAALAFLGHTVPGELTGAPQQEIWSWAIDNWQLSAVPETASS